MTDRSCLLPLADQACEAWIWGLPLIEMAQQRAAWLHGGPGPHVFTHQRGLMKAKGSFVTTPNNDTLYSQAWIDLAAGPVTVTLPPAGDRYFSLALMDMYTNNFAVLGTRTTGTGGGVFQLVGPHEAVERADTIRSPTRWVWALARTLIDDEGDLPAAHAVQEGLTLSIPGGSRPAAATVDRKALWSDFFAAVQALMNECQPPATDGAVLERFARLVAPGGTFDSSRFSAGEAAEIEAGVTAARQIVRTYRRNLRPVNGWQISSADLGDFRQNYGLRAAVALGGLAALPRHEAVYYTARGLDGISGFDSSRNWKLTFVPEALPPVDSFWSLTLYKVTPEGQLYFVDNPMERYAIGDRSKGLTRAADGSLTIWMTRTDPGGEASANWLPSPQAEPFILSLRTYLPRREILDGLYSPPQLEPI